MFAQFCYFRTLASRLTVAVKRLSYRVQQFMFSKRLGEKFCRPGFHSLY
jgi:hypothetical protein